MNFEHILAARIPIIGVETDDFCNFELVLSTLSGLKVQEMPSKSAKLGPFLYWTGDMEDVTVENYRKLAEGEHQLVVVNPVRKSSLIFSAGELPTPKSLVMVYLETMLEKGDAELAYSALKGLSLKAVSEVVMLTQARTGSMSVKELRHTRSMLGNTVQGLTPVETESDFYQFPEKLLDWLNTNKHYFLADNMHPKLRPRGVMLEGSPGVGKTMAAKAIAKSFGVPLYRLDIASTLNRYLGESESRIVRSLALVEAESPCVLLIDEVEKVFSDKDDTGVVTRMMSQVLYWLSDHQSRVLTVMTTNNLTHIPPELYRMGRVDMVMKIPKLSMLEAKNFAQSVFQSVVNKKPNMNQLAKLSDVLKLTGNDEFAHAEVAELVFSTIKKNNYFHHLTNQK